MSEAPAHHAIKTLSSAGDDLLVGGIALRRLAERVGSTPFYVYDRALIERRIEELRTALPPGVLLHYAVKANPMPALVGFIAPRVDGLDVASAGELQVALDTGIDPGLVSFAGPGKRAIEIEQTIAAGSIINVESEREVEVATGYCERTGYEAHLAVRVNPKFELKSSGLRMGGGAKAFGIDEESVPKVIRRIVDRGLHFAGLHIYSGSQNLRAESIAESQDAVIAAGVRIAAEAGVRLGHLNVGGGFGIPYFPGEAPLDLADLGQRMGEILARHASGLDGTRIIVELGRYLVGEAGFYVCRVVDRKISRGEVFLVTDGGLHQHLAASGNFGQVIRKNYPLVIGTRMSQPRDEVVDVVGPLCTPLDLLGRRIAAPHADVGDLVVVLQSGAYGLSASPTRFLGHPQPREIVV